MWIELNWIELKQGMFVQCSKCEEQEKRKLHVLFLREFCVLNCVYVVRRMVVVCTKNTFFNEFPITYAQQSTA